MVRLIQTVLSDPNSSLLLPQLEADINYFVYDLYSLAPEEIKIVDNFNKIER